MPELKPLPCPKCGITSKMLDLEPCGTDEYAVQCRCCGLCGPVGCPGEYDRHNGEAVEKAEVEARENAIEAWNALPRALRWTTEPPNVAGFYFLKMASGTISMVYLSDQDIKDKDWHGSVSQWVAIAGPITTPID